MRTSIKSVPGQVGIYHDQRLSCVLGIFSKWLLVGDLCSWFVKLLLLWNMECVFFSLPLFVLIRTNLANGLNISNSFASIISQYVAEKIVTGCC